MGVRNAYTDLLIIGAGPAGLMAACWASQYPIKTRIIDKKSGRTPTGHADGINSRTMEILDSFGVADFILRQAVCNMESSYWGPDEVSGNIRRIKKERCQPQKLSRFQQMLLNQGAIEQILIDYLDHMKRVHVERSRKADGLEPHSHCDPNRDDEYPVHVRVVSANGEDRQPDDTEVIHAKYLVACDGAHSWAQKQLQVPFEVWNSESKWGVMDIVPITDFHDAEAIQTKLQALRLVVYVPGRRLIKQYRTDRIFFAGDAAHIHSPKGGQGMNVSMQDTYNLVWKLALVITRAANPAILDTYHQERHPVAEELMRFDDHLVHAYEEGDMEDDGKADVEAVRNQFAGFRAGVGATYSPNILVQKGGANAALAGNIQLGKRLPSHLVVGQADGCPVHLAEKLSSNGCWRLLVFSGDLHCSRNLDRVSLFAKEFNDRFHQFTAHWATNCHLLETLLIHSSPRSSVNLLDLPDVFHQFDDDLGWDYAKVFADDPSYDGHAGEAYEQYGIDKQTGCLVVCRPDQHVGWIGEIDDVEGLEKYFSPILFRQQT
ncbi:hypothetical protein BBP40_006395 [Aspergillus hancockii]|nr:hypothetical protein BBP40_006395 [Aspergillus hancockii]